MNGFAIKDGSKVIIKRDSYLRFEEVRLKKKVSMHKLHFFLDNAIGCPYGSTFEVKDSKLFLKQSCDSKVSQSKSSTTSGESNEFINDDGSSQKLSKDDIMALKSGGVAGEDIIDQLIEHSESFDKKTEFSQEKYLKKKKKRHIAEITIFKPTLPLVCEMMYTNSPGKIMELRMDTVSQILTMANIQSNTNVLLLENTQSFLAGVILDRMGGLGNLIQLYNGDFPVRLCLSCFDLEKKDMKILSGFPMNKINALKRPGLVTEDNCKSSSETTAEASDVSTTNHEKMELGPATVEEKSSTHNEESHEVDSKNHQNYHKTLTDEEKVNRKKKRDEEEDRALLVLKKFSMDSLIIASKFRAKTTLLKLIEFLAPSRPLVVYSPYKEVLVECYTALKELKNVVLLNLSETWWRSYQAIQSVKCGLGGIVALLVPREYKVAGVSQNYSARSRYCKHVLSVLSMRTHPQITMDGSGGYLLTGIRVDNTNGNADCSDAKPGHSPVKRMKME